MEEKCDDAFNRSFKHWATTEAPSHLATSDPTTHTLKKKKKQNRSKNRLTLPKQQKSDSPTSHGEEAASVPMPTRERHPSTHVNVPYTQPAITQYKTYVAPTYHKTASHKGVPNGHRNASSNGHIPNDQWNHDFMRDPETFDGRRVKQENFDTDSDDLPLYEDHAIPTNELQY